MTKRVLTKAAALLVAGLLGVGSVCVRARAQVFTPNVVGYYNVSLTPGYNFLANQLRATNNGIKYVIPVAPDGAKVYLWDVGSQTYSPASTFNAATTNWDINYLLPPGTGFVMQVSAPWTNVFVGEVLQGWLTNFIAGSNRFSLLSSLIPQAGQITSVLGFPGTDGENTHFFSSTTQSFLDACTFFNGYGWFDPNGIAGPGGPTEGVGQSFLVQNPGPNTNWVRYFIVQAPPPPGGGGTSAGTGTTSAVVSQIKITGKTVNLAVSNPVGASYQIQFSRDGLAWTTIATSQTGKLWTGSWPGGPRGFYRLAPP